MYIADTHVYNYKINYIERVEIHMDDWYSYNGNQKNKISYSILRNFEEA